MLINFLNWLQEQIILHQRHGAERPDLRIILTDDQQRDLWKVSDANSSSLTRIENYATPDKKYPYRFKEIMGVEVITAAPDVELPIPLVVRLASI